MGSKRQAIIILKYLQSELRHLKPTTSYLGDYDV